MYPSVLARKIKITTDDVKMIESGEITGISVEVMLRIAKATDYPIGFFYQEYREHKIIGGLLHNSYEDYINGVFDGCSK